ncbi:MAG: L-threonylcarbamoyladenylate synthase [bacterium]|nr:L-threonylcarbamoyladenylate synthase [bacterium]
MIVKPTDDKIKEAASIIKKGGLVAFVTETVYGLGANGLNPEAIAKVFQAKKRPLSDPLPLHIADRNWLFELVYLNDTAEALMDRFWPGPLTLVLPKKDIIPKIVTAGLSKVGLRMPKSIVALQLIKEIGVPITGTSANITGFPSPRIAKDVEKYLGDRVELVLDGGVCEIGLESTILDLTGERAVLLRKGAIELSELEGVVGKGGVKIL